jgi:O-antigen/teichoic acid export membrane protein
MTKNIATSILSFVASLFLSFFVSPMILRNLGDVRYGIWALFGEILGYYGLLDFGVRGAVNYFAGKALAQQDDAAVSRYVSSAFFGLIGLSILVLATSVSLVLAFRHMLGPGGVDDTEIVVGAICFLGIFAAGLPIEVFAAVLVGGRKAYLVSTSELVSRLFSTALMVVVLLKAPSIVWLAAAQLAGRLLYWGAVLHYVRKYVPEATVRRANTSFGTLRELLQYGSKNAVIDISWLLVNRKDVTLTTIFLGPQWVASFSFARIAVQSLSQACSSITQPARPNLVYHWARGEFDQAYAIYYKIVRYSSYVAFMVGAFLTPFGSDFLRLWVGERMVTGNVWFRADVVLWLLLLAQLPRMMHSMSWQLLFAQHRQKPLMILISIEAVVNIAMALVLVQPYGTVGLAIATAIPMFISHTIVLPIIMQRVAGVSLRRYLVDGIGRPLAGGLAVALAGFVLRGFHPATRWADLFSNAAVLAALALGIGFFAVLGGDDRQRVLSMASAVRARLRPKAAAS